MKGGLWSLRRSQGHGFLSHSDDGIYTYCNTKVAVSCLHVTWASGKTWNPQTNMGSLEILLMDDTSIKQTPRTMCMSNLKLFSFGGSKVQDFRGLELLPFSGCSQLSDMYLTDCNLYKFPDNFSCLSSLQSLCLSRNSIENLPGSIKKLHHLKSLYLKNCKNLISLPVLPSNQYLDVHGCISLETVSKPMTLLVIAEKTHSTFVFTDCYKLNRDAQEKIVAHTQLKSQILANRSFQLNHKVQSLVILLLFQ